jgi:ribonucleoside-diphosphate reductase alpha chain
MNYSEPVRMQVLDSITFINEDEKKRYITFFINKYSENIDKKYVIFDKLVEDICMGLPNYISVNDLYNYIADICMSKTSYHYDYGTIASKICMDKIHMNTQESIINVAAVLFGPNNEIKTNEIKTNEIKTNELQTNDLQTNEIKTDEPEEENQQIISSELYDTINKHGELIQSRIKFERDYLFDYFGIKTLERSYLFKRNKIIVERPQHMIMRVALGIHMNDLEKAFETYDLMSQQYFTHATPTLFNAGTPRNQLSSCFLLGVDDNIESMYDKVKEMALISKWAGGIGIHLSSIRSRGGRIRGTNGVTDGIIPYCIVLNKLAKHINQGGKRQGSIACYIEPWHADIFDFCELRKNTGNDDNRARDLFLALWVPDLFMQRVKSNGVWSLMCPDRCPDLFKVHGEEFNKLYISYEQAKKYKRQVRAIDLWKHIMVSQLETGFPYMLYKDHANNKSNQKNLGTIRSSNLCTEIIEYSDSNETAVCNLASICLPRFIENGVFNYDKLKNICEVIVNNLNIIIDINYYPVETAKLSNMRHRPIGIGVQGLADVYNIMGYPFDSEEAYAMNKIIFETIYFGCLVASNKLAIKDGTYSSYKGSPISQGLLQYHMWGLTEKDLSGLYDWASLIESIKKYGVRNSLLTTMMPTATTSQIMNCSEGIEPRMTNFFVRTTLAGEFIVVRDLLIKALIKDGIWDEDMRKLIIIHNGILDKIPRIPDKIKKIFSSAFDKNKSIIKQSIERGPFIDQSQSLNLFMDKPSFTKLNSAHFYGWEGGLKTGMYYMHSAPAARAIPFSIDINDLQRLLGTTNVVDIVSNSYKITENNNKELIHEQKEEPKDNSKEEPKEETSGNYCKYVRGRKPDDCMMCSG